MAKRVSHFQGRQQIGKKPKLDISYNNPALGYEKNNAALVHRENRNNDNNSSNIWDDDDDDVILLASQAFEAIEQSSQQIIIEQQSSMFGVDVTFTKFGQNSEIQTSTQIVKDKILPQSSTSKVIPLRSEDYPPNNNAEDDDDDGLFCNIDIDEVCGSKKAKLQNKERNPFKKPITTGLLSKDVNNENRYSKTSSEIRSTTDKRRKDAAEVQLDFLTSRSEALRKENEKLNKDVIGFNEKLQTKDGEISNLRYEIRNLKQLNERLRLEKMEITENVKKQWHDKVQELEKTVATQLTELQFKSAEINNLKVAKVSHRLNETMNFSQLQQQQSVHIDNSKMIKNKIDKLSLCNLHVSDNISSVKISLRNYFDVPLEIFENSLVKRHTLSFLEELFHLELIRLQDILAQLEKKNPFNDIILNKFESKISSSLRKCLPELKEYIHGLKYPKYPDTSALLEYKFLSQRISESASLNNTEIYANITLFPEEKAISIRRYIAALYLLCCNTYMNPIIMKILYEERFKGYTLIKILIDSIEQIGFSKELFHHFGLIESFAYLLKSFTKDPQSVIENNQYYLIAYIKQLIFCRPNIRSLISIALSLNYLSQNTDDTPNSSYNLKILNSICSNKGRNDDKNIFSLNEYFKIFQFSPDSCILQIYGVLLESPFPQDVKLTKQQIKYLSQLCYNHIRFMQNCINKREKIHWVITNEQNKQPQQQKLCDCYIRITTGFVILFHLLLKHWTQDLNCIEFRELSKILRYGIMLLCNICTINYKREVLQIGGITIRNRIKIIYDWLNDYKNLLQFELAHEKALEFIKFSHAMADSLQNFEEIKDEQHNLKLDDDKMWSEIIINEFTCKI